MPSRFGLMVPWPLEGLRGTWPNILCNREIGSLPPVGKLGRSGIQETVGTRYSKRRCHAVSIASLAVALMYLFLVLVGAVGTLFLVVWLFREAPSEAKSMTRTTMKRARNANSFSEGGTPPAPTQIELPEDRAA